MKTKFNYILLFMCLPFFFSACTEREIEPQPDDSFYQKWQADSASLRIAVTPTMDCLPLMVAEEEHLFEQQGVQVSLYPYSSQMDCDTALVSGWVHGMVSDLVRTERLKRQGVPLTYITATDQYWQLLSHKAIHLRRLSQLKDKMVGVTRFSATAMLLDELVDSASLSEELVFPLQVNDVNLRLNMLKDRILNIVFLPEPQASVARSMGAQIHYDTRWNDVRLGVIAVNSSAMADTLLHRQIQGLLKAYDAACSRIDSVGVSSYHTLLKVRCGVDEKPLDSIASAMTYSGTAKPRQKDIDKAVRWLDKY